jgi:hypothetical protein
VDPNAPRVVIPGKVQPPAEHLVTDAKFLQIMDESARKMTEMLDAGYTPTLGGAFLSRVANSATEQDGMAAFATQLLAAKARGEIDAAGQEFETYATNFLNAVLRDESGAAVPVSEYPKYIATMIPTYGDTPERIAAKRHNVAMAIEARRQGLKLEAISAIALGQNPAAAIVNGGAPAPAAQSQRVDPAQARNDAVAAHAAIDAQPISDAEKMAKHRAVDARMNQIMGGGQ